MIQERILNPFPEITREIFNTLLERDGLSPELGEDPEYIDFNFSMVRQGNFSVVLVERILGYRPVNVFVEVSKRMHKDPFNYEVGYRRALHAALTSEPTDLF